MTDTLCVIQARMGSTRLPGKVLKHIGRYPAISHTVTRARSVLPTVVATTAGPKDAPLREYLQGQGFDCYAWDGDENDVLGRYAAVARVFRPKVIVRCTADCPWIDPDVVREIAEYDGRPDWKRPPYWSNVGLASRSYPRGQDVEAFTVELLEEANERALSTHDREHVTPWMMRRDKVGAILWRDIDLSYLRWCLDTPDDLAWFRAVAREIDTDPPHPTTAELLALLDRRPDLVRLDT